MSKIKLGAYNTLTVLKVALREGNGDPFGLYLDGGPAGEILMPQRYVPEETEIGDDVEVFVYLDQDERPIATTEDPLAQVGDFAYLECSWVNEYGAFLSWGVMKDLFCPFREQKKRMVIGNSYIVIFILTKKAIVLWPLQRWNITLTSNHVAINTDRRLTCWYGRKPTLVLRSLSTISIQGSSTKIKCSSMFTLATV